MLFNVTVTLTMNSPDADKAVEAAIDWLDLNTDLSEAGNGEGWHVHGAVPVEQPMSQFVTFPSSWIEGARFLMLRLEGGQEYLATLYPADVLERCTAARLAGL